MVAAVDSKREAMPPALEDMAPLKTNSFACRLRPPGG